MSCGPCAAVRQYAYNVALTLDLAVNAVCLLGSPHESVSERTARARAAGSRSAAAFCAVLTWFGTHVFRSRHGDHCTWALAAQAADADEVWHWSPP